jgi:predicted transcriptional regulator of viral defense system
MDCTGRRSRSSSRVLWNAVSVSVWAVGPATTNSSEYGGPSLDEQILAGARHNVVTTDDLLGLGLTHSDIGYRVERGRLHRKYKGVFAVGRPDLRIEGVFLAAVLACGPRATLSHKSAARLWNLTRAETSRIDVTAPRSVKPKPGIRLHRPLSLDALDTTIVEGIPVTSVAQTLLDLAAPAWRESGRGQAAARGGRAADPRHA